MRCSKGVMAVRPSPAPSRSPCIPVGLRKGSTELFSLLQDGEEKAMLPDPVPGLSLQRPTGIELGFPGRGLVRFPGAVQSREVSPHPHVTHPHPFPRQEVMPAGRTARWTHPAPVNPSTSGSSSKSCC